MPSTASNGRGRVSLPTSQTAVVRSHGCSVTTDLSSKRARGSVSSPVAVIPWSVNVTSSTESCLSAPRSTTVIGDSTSSTALRTPERPSSASPTTSAPDDVSTSIGYGSPEKLFVSKLLVR